MKTRNQVVPRRMAAAMRRALRESLAHEPSALFGRHDFASLSPEDKLRATASLARFVNEHKGKAARHN